MMDLSHYQAYLFDLDGTLVNSEPLKGKAIAFTCKHYGKEVDYHIYNKVMGQSWSQVTQYFFGQAGISPNQVEFDSHFKRFYQKLLLENLSLNQGADKFIAQAVLQQKRCAIVSSSARWMVDHILSALDLDRYMEVIVSREDVNHHKPHPESYLKALNALQLSAKQALVFEDTESGLEAANMAECDIIAVKHSFNVNNNLSLAKCCIDDFSQLL